MSPIEVIKKHHHNPNRQGKRKRNKYPVVSGISFGLTNGAVVGSFLS